jgi:hypothetical protein
MLEVMGAPGTTAEALFCAYYEALLAYRAAVVTADCTQKRADKQYAEDARVIFFASKRAYFESAVT